MADSANARELAIRSIVSGGILATDYDGCSSPLHDIAEEAWRIRGVLPAMQELGTVPRGLVVVISGRPRRFTEGKRGIEDFLRTNQVHERDSTGANILGTEVPTAHFDPDGMGYVLDDGRRGGIHVIANHGADMDPSLIQTEEDEVLAGQLFAPMSETDAEIRERLIAELPTTLQDKFPDFPITQEVDPAQPERIYLEVKPEGVAVHTRTLAKTRPGEAAGVLAFTEEFYRNRAEAWGHELHATPGSNVLDIQVRPASKGRPIIYLKQKFPGQPITYIGDDITDIAAMRQLTEGDTAIIIGNRITEELDRQGLALGVNVLRLADPGELAAFLGDAAAAHTLSTQGQQRRVSDAATRVPLRLGDPRTPRHAVGSAPATGGVFRASVLTESFQVTQISANH